MFEHNKGYGNREVIEFAKRRYMDLKELNSEHDLLCLVEIDNQGLRLKNDIMDERYNFALVVYARSLGRAIREELEKKLDKAKLLGMVKAYF